MGREAECRVDFGGRSSRGKALLETDHVLFRGEFRLKLPFAGLRSVEAAGGTLRLECADGVAAFDLGADAAKWAEKIRNPPSRLAKLGVKAGVRVAVERIGDAAFREELQVAGAEFAERDLDLLFLGANSEDDLAAVAPGRLKPAGAVWVIYPKGRKDFGEAHVRGAGLAAGLVDTKVAAFSPALTALKFVIPVSKR